MTWTYFDWAGEDRQERPATSGFPCVHRGGTMLSSDNSVPPRNRNHLIGRSRRGRVPKPKQAHRTRQKGCPDAVLDLGA